MTDPVPAPLDYKNIVMGLLALLGAAGGGLGLGSQLHAKDAEPEVIAYRLGLLESSVATLATEVRALAVKSGDRWTRDDHAAYARAVESRLVRLERQHD